MSYTPTVIFSHEDLVEADEKHKISGMYFSGKEDIRFQYLTNLQQYLNMASSVFPEYKGSHIIAISTYLSSEYEALKDLLYDLEIEYTAI